MDQQQSKPQASDVAARMLCFCAIEALAMISSTMTLNVAAQPVDVSHLNLSLSLGGGTTALESTSECSKNLLSKIMLDDVEDEFKLTQETLKFVSDNLRSFANQEGISTAEGQSNSVSLWLANLVRGQAQSLAQFQGTPLEKLTVELDFVYGNYWNAFGNLINKIITENPSRNQINPSQIGNNNLSFRCERVDEMKQLRELSSKSSLYFYIFEIFSNELYSHCLRRKLAMIKLNALRPASIVRQFVELYLDVPVKYSQALIMNQMSSDEMTNEIISGLALSFNLEESIKRHGLPRDNTNLILDSDTNQTHLLEKFKSECQQHLLALSQYWTNFDSLAAFLSSPTNNLAEFNEKIKLVSPQLVYAKICSQLIATV